MTALFRPKGRKIVFFVQSFGDASTYGGEYPKDSIAQSKCQGITVRVWLPLSNINSRKIQ